MDGGAKGSLEETAGSDEPGTKEDSADDILETIEETADDTGELDGMDVVAFDDNTGGLDETVGFEDTDGTDESGRSIVSFGFVVSPPWFGFMGSSGCFLSDVIAGVNNDLVSFSA